MPNGYNQPFHTLNDFIPKESIFFLRDYEMKLRVSISTRGLFLRFLDLSLDGAKLLTLPSFIGLNKVDLLIPTTVRNYVGTTMI